MPSPPFKLRVLPQAALHHAEGDTHLSAADCCGGHEVEEAAGKREVAGRAHLSQLDPHLHCSVIGTCMSTAELRKLMARHFEVAGLSDLAVHHEAVRLASGRGEVAKALHKALDHRHEANLRTFNAARDAGSLALAWEEALRQGEIPGAYWALLTHRQVTPELRQQAFGEVHMLSHLVGSANRADIRRLVALERENNELHERLEREQQRRQEIVGERDELAARLQELALKLGRFEAMERDASAAPQPASTDQAQIALHTARRETAEQSAIKAWAEVGRLREDLEHLRRHAEVLGQELSVAETELQALSSAQNGEGAQQASAGGRLLSERLQRRRILYVGGRPSSTPAIRDLVHRHGGEFTHHDGGLEARKGLLGAAIPGADLVVFPVDCIDHDSAQNLKRLSERHGVPFLALRKASVASFAAALSADDERLPASEAGRPRFCLRHG